MEWIRAGVEAAWEWCNWLFQFSALTLAVPSSFRLMMSKSKSLLRPSVLLRTMCPVSPSHCAYRTGEQWEREVRHTPGAKPECVFVFFCILFDLLSHNWSLERYPHVNTAVNGRKLLLLFLHPWSNKSHKTLLTSGLAWQLQHFQLVSHSHVSLLNSSWENDTVSLTLTPQNTYVCFKADFDNKLMYWLTHCQ